jgi:predicted flap endonuclease-1-like 5' DNA nuclease
MNIPLLIRSVIRSYFTSVDKQVQTEETTVTIEQESSETIEINADDSDTHTLQDVDGVGPAYETRINDIGIESVQELSEMSIEELQSELSISEDYANRWLTSAEKIAN